MQLAVETQSAVETRAPRETRAAAGLAPAGSRAPTDDLAPTGTQPPTADLAPTGTRPPTDDLAPTGAQPPTADLAPAGARPAVRLRPVPRYEPPFDDELTPPTWSSAQQLALDWPRRAAPSSTDAPPTAPATGGKPRRRSGGTEPDPKELAALTAAPVVAGASGDARLAVKRFVHLCVEVLNGYRPAAHLRRLSLPAEAAEVASQGLAGARRVTEMRRPRRSGDRRSARPSPVAVIKVNLCEPRPGAVEAAVALVTGERTWAMALRLELHDDSWCATTLRLI
nr:Rv3235 family protein [Actinoplanes regularis]